MNPTHNTRMRARAGVFLCAVIGWTFASCASAPPAQTEEDSIPETTFDYAGDRVPTAKTLHTMAHILAKKGNDPQCEIVLRKLLSAHPQYAPGYNEFAELCMRQDRSDEAVAVLEAGTAAVPGDSVLWNNLGLVRLMREELDDAREAFTSACAIAPTDARPRANLAVALAMSGRLEEAEAVYLQATSRSNAYHDLSVICEARGDAENAQLYEDLSEGKRPKREQSPR